MNPVSPSPLASSSQRSRRIHPSWVVAGVTLVALVGAAGFRAAPGPLMVPMNEEFGWTTGEMSRALSINLLLFGVTAPFAAALMDRFGIRRVVSGALALIAAGAGGTLLVTAPWQLMITWGLLIGLGTGSMALVLANTISNRWFLERRGFVMGILTAGSAAGQLVLLPVVAGLAESSGWRPASLVIAGVALSVVPLVLWKLRDYPDDVGAIPYGATEGWVPPARPTTNAAARAIAGLKLAVRSKSYWYLAGAFAICGATTNGLIGIHFIPSAHDHGMETTVAAGLLAMVGIFDVIGTVASGWLTDRYSPRLLLAAYYFFRGVGLLALPVLLSDEVRPSMIVFIVIYGLDWVATVPPTAALSREVFGDDGPIVFGWIFAAHQVGAATAALGAGAIRDAFGSYTYAWISGAALCVVASLLSARVPKGPATNQGAAVSMAEVC